MSQLILDFGSGNTCLNDWPTAKRMIDALAEIDKERKCIIKWQLFEKAGDNLRLDPRIFFSALIYARGLGFKTTASVFDLFSLRILLTHEVPFVKIANRRDLDWLIGEVPRKVPVIRSIGQSGEQYYQKWVHEICCVSKYPAQSMDYISRFAEMELCNGISDHTTDWTLYRKYQPKIYEVHFRLEDSTGPDAGPFARTPEQIAEILA